MITPAVLISACGTLIFSTSSRLARIVERARTLNARTLQQLAEDDAGDFAAERRAELERDLALQAKRVRLIQSALATLYFSLGIFVATTIAIALTSWVGFATALPAFLGVFGTLILFLACILLIREVRLALRGVKEEMSFAQKLRGLHAARRETQRRA